MALLGLMFHCVSVVLCNFRLTTPFRILKWTGLTPQVRVILWKSVINHLAVALQTTICKYRDLHCRLPRHLVKIQFRHLHCRLCNMRCSSPLENAEELSYLIYLLYCASKIDVSTANLWGYARYKSPGNILPFEETAKEMRKERSYNFAYGPCFSE